MIVIDNNYIKVTEEDFNKKLVTLKKDAADYFNVTFTGLHTDRYTLSWKFWSRRDLPIHLIATRVADGKLVHFGGHFATREKIDNETWVYVPL